MNKIKVMVVDDQKLIRDSLKMMLEMEDDMQWVGEADNGKDALKVAQASLPDIVLMDIRMPKGDGVQGTEELCKWNPNIKVLILTTFDDQEFVLSALRKGASGYLLKDIPSEELMQAIRTIHEKGAILQPQITVTLLKHIQAEQDLASDESLEEQAVDKIQLTNTGGLTSREQEVLQKIALGHSNQQIAEQLFITEGTVKNHINNIMSKLHLHERSHLVIFALTGAKPNV